MSADKAFNPLDVEGLEKSLSDSATRVSTIWITYLLFGLYLLVTAGTATDKQLLLADPLKLPALGTDVPLVSFFVLSPIFFVLLQIYVLLQTLLLGRTAQAYNNVVDSALADPKENATFRERLANTIFAQIFAGAPRERGGWVGSVLREIRWFTLVGSPILILLTFQLAFLPYHSQEVTWVHRLLIYAQVVMAFTLWPAVVDPAKEFAWNRLDFRFWRRTVRGTGRQFNQIVAILVVIFSTFLLSFPGEWHINLVSFRKIDSRACDRWIPSALGLDKMIVIDRLVLRDVAIIDPDMFNKMGKDAPTGEKLYEGARSKELSGRDFVCGQFDGIDFRRAALEGAHFDGSFLTGSRLDGARMTGAFFRDAKLSGATLHEVDLRFADLAGIDLSDAMLTDVMFGAGARLSGANLSGLKMAGPLRLESAHLEAASFQDADLTKAVMTGAILDGADFSRAQLPSPAPTLPDSAFLSKPGYDKDEAAQQNFAANVAQAVCGPNLSDNQRTTLRENRTQIVTGIVTNALFPAKGDPQCKTAEQGSKPICPPEQPNAYRAKLIELLDKCPIKSLSADAAEFLRSGGPATKKP